MIVKINYNGFEYAATLLQWLNGRAVIENPLGEVVTLESRNVTIITAAHLEKMLYEIAKIKVENNKLKEQLKRQQFDFDKGWIACEQAARKEEAT